MIDDLAGRPHPETFKVHHRYRRQMVAAPASIAVAFFVMLGLGGAMAQAPQIPRATGSTQPDLNGIWQAVGTAHWDIERHAAGPGPILALGAVGAVPGGLGVVEDGQIPYQPWALEKKKQNLENWLTADPEIKCYLPGVPRATYLPFPFQIFQSGSKIVIAYEFAGARRIIEMENHKEPPIDSWMGWSNGHWEGNTLVVDVTGFNDQTWFDRAGNFHSENLHVIERYTPVTADHLMYEATIEDPKVFTRPWKMSMPLYRRRDAGIQLVEFKCVEFVEELLYGRFLAKPKN